MKSVSGNNLEELQKFLHPQESSMTILLSANFDGLRKFLHQCELEDQRTARRIAAGCVE